MSSQTRTEQVNDRLVCRWVPVVDEHGRTRMEARWATPDRQATPHPHAA